MRRFQFLIAAVSVAAVAASASAQSTLAERVSRAPDGVVRVQFASRPGTCGDGRDVVGFRKAIFAGSVESFGDWTSDRCVPGPVRVALTVTSGRVTQVQTYVGGTWGSSSSRVTDIGTVSAAEASAYFFGLVPQLEGRSNKARFLLPAVLADDNSALARLTSLARDAARAQETRRQAIHWIGMLGGAADVPTLVAFARQGEGQTTGPDDLNDQGPSEAGLAGTAVAALSFLPNGVGIPALIDFARNGAARNRANAVFWLGQSGDPRAIAVLHSVIENNAENERVRARAIFSLSHGDVDEPEFAYLRRLYPRLGTTRLKEAVIQAMTEDKSAGSTWLLEKARDGDEAVKVRKTALFWAGQRELTPTRDLVAFYRSVPEKELRDHAIFVLSQREDDAAITELLRIAREEPDRQLRSRALFWLGQKDDPRVAKLISDRLSK